jgi:fructokinase
MHRSDLIKMNDEELDEISSYLGLSVNSIQKRMVALSEYLKKDLSICVTKGAAGAELQHENRCYQNVGYPVSVADTVGAGDSFLATLSYNLLNGTPPQKALDRACAMGSLVASREGANPKVEEQEIIQMLGVQ